MFQAVTTVEGILRRTLEALRQDQPVRRIMNPEDAEQVKKQIKIISKCQFPLHSSNLFSLI